MLVDWFTVAAQLINFTILVWLLKRLLYKRVLKAMDERQETILLQASKAEMQRAQAETEAAAYTEKLALYESEYAARMKNAEEEVREFRNGKLSEVRKEIQEQRAEWNLSLERQRHEFVVELRKLVGNQICETAKKLISDLGDAPLEQQVLRHFAGSMTGDSETGMALLAAKADAVAISTTFPVDDETKAFVQKSIAPLLPPGSPIDYETDHSGGTLGVVLRAGNHRLEWNVDSYTDQLSATVEKALFPQGKPELVPA